MKLPSVGIIGGGRVTHILVGGWRHAGVSIPEMVVSDPDSERRQRLLAKHPDIAVVTDNRTPAGQEVVFLAVHPPALPAVLSEIRGAIKPGTLVVYLGAKFTLQQLQQGLGGHTGLARLIPNAPSIIGAGHNPVAFHTGASEHHREQLAALFGVLGSFPEVDENKLEAYILLTGMGPTYLWPQFQELLDLSISLGLDIEEGKKGLEAMVCGAIRTLLHSGLTSAETQDLVLAKPLAEDMPSFLAAYQARLPAVHAGILPPS